MIPEDKNLTTKPSDRELAIASQWQRIVTEAHQFPIGDINALRDLLRDINSRQYKTRMEFHLLPVVDGAVSPDVQYDIPHYRATTTGAVIQATLETLPETVRKGYDEAHEVWQIRLDDWDSWDHAIGETTLIMVLLDCHHEQEACFLFPGDEAWRQNWVALQKMHAEHFT